MLQLAHFSCEYVHWFPCTLRNKISCSRRFGVTNSGHPVGALGDIMVKPWNSGDMPSVYAASRQEGWLLASSG